MTTSASVTREAVLAQLSLSAYDLATRDKIPGIQRLMKAEGPGLALDIGIGTGYTTYKVFGQRPTVCVDITMANLSTYRRRVSSSTGGSAPHCVVAQATALPFTADVFRFVLCSEVMEHVEDDSAVAAEIGRVLAPGGTAVVTVPNTSLGFTSFLELLGIKTVHDFPGPERHVRPGYDEASLCRLMKGKGLQLENRMYYFRFFTRLAADVVSLAHILYQRLAHKRRAWTWSDVTRSEHGIVFRSYALLFPALWAFSRFDRLLESRPGFGLIVAARKLNEQG